MKKILMLVVPIVLFAVFFLVIRPLMLGKNGDEDMPEIKEEITPTQ